MPAVVQPDPVEAGGLRDAGEPVRERVDVERFTVAALADEVERDGCDIRRPGKAETPKAAR
jgi:hypothetical protein